MRSVLVVCFLAAGCSATVLGEAPPDAGVVAPDAGPPCTWQRGTTQTTTMEGYIVLAGPAPGGAVVWADSLPVFDGPIEHYHLSTLRLDADGVAMGRPRVVLDETSSGVASDTLEQWQQAAGFGHAGGVYDGASACHFVPTDADGAPTGPSRVLGSGYCDRVEATPTGFRVFIKEPAGHALVTLAPDGSGSTVHELGHPFATTVSLDDAGGPFLAVWGGSSGLQAGVFAPDGSPRGEAHAIPGNVSADLVAVSWAARVPGGALVLWSAVETASTRRLMVTRIDDSGVAVGAPTALATVPYEGRPFDADIASAGDGAVLAWTALSTSPDASGTWAQPLRADGTPAGPALGIGGAAPIVRVFTTPRGALVTEGGARATPVYCER